MKSPSRAILAVTAMILTSAPAFAAPGLWQWGQMDLSEMKDMTMPQLSKHIGGWVYASDGSIVGSLESVSGDSATVKVSSFFKPSDPHVMVPVNDIGTIHGKLVIHGMTYTP